MKVGVSGCQTQTPGLSFMRVSIIPISAITLLVSYRVCINSTEYTSVIIFFIEAGRADLPRQDHPSAQIINGLND